MSDLQQRFIFENATIRGELIHLQDCYQTIINQRQYPPMVKHLLGEALVSCLLIASSIKFRGRLTLQFQGDERLPMLIVQANERLQVRAHAKFAPNIKNKEYAEAFLKGQLAFIIKQEKQTQAYQSMVPICSTSMSENIAYYFQQSEQVPTQVWLAVRDDIACGMLLQAMPNEKSQIDEDSWNYALAMAQTITEDELLQLNNVTLLHRLYHETTLRLFEPRTPVFACQCNEEKMKAVLKMLGKEDIDQLVNERGNVEVQCDFCNKSYQFDSIDVTLMFRD